MPKIGTKHEEKKCCLFCFKQTYVSTCIFQGLFKNIVFRSVALVTEKLWAILDFFFHRPDFYSVPYPTLYIKKKYFLAAEGNS